MRPLRIRRPPAGRCPRPRQRRRARTGRPGPVLIDLPKDILNRATSWREPVEFALPGYKPTVAGHAGQIKRAAEAIRQTRERGGRVIAARSPRGAREAQAFGGTTPSAERHWRLWPACRGRAVRADWRRPISWWLAGAAIAVLIPDSGLPRLVFAVFFLILLLNTAAAAPDRVRLLRSLAVTLGAAFATIYRAVNRSQEHQLDQALLAEAYEEHRAIEKLVSSGLATPVVGAAPGRAVGWRP